jgi:hypothetical protein
LEDLVVDWKIVLELYGRNTAVRHALDLYESKQGPMADCPERDNKSPGSKKGGKFLQGLFDSHDSLARLELDGLLFSANNEVTIN